MKFYFIPLRKFPVGQFKSKVKEILENMRIIDGYYDEENELLGAGEKSSFEYASIHDTPNDKLVPEASTSGYGATCSKCNSDMDHELYDKINDYYDFESDSGEERDMKSIQLICPECTTTSTLNEVVFTQPVLLTNQYFQFVDIDDEIDPKVIRGMESALDCDLKVIYERM